ncbi:GTP-binding protein [Flammeovirga sp. MY04]|uniref:CobW family GTP-binding protein n=1 Tax=Flammeovirga sp. MY04 TaxID=1191459 RepID=UPI0008063D76|nr:GTP-binding protein [Flammeovirga sp. MY04]ANQ48351.1 GTP-binding protein [Flammeovirga sp. MY04]
MEKKIGVTILTGFLGAGKTTFLNNLIQKYPNTKFAVIENEFGEVNIDSDLVVDNQEGVFELSNGCICCNLNGELREVLRNLLNCGKDIDHLIVETTGIAEPDGVAAAFVGDPGISRLFEINATIGLIDVQNFEFAINNHPVAMKQISFSDYLVFTKCDLATEEEIKKVKFQAKFINPLAQVGQVSKGEVIDKDIINLNAYSADKVIERASFVAHDHNHQHGDVVSHSFTFKGTVDPVKLEMWLSVLFNLQFEVIYRFKGIFNIKGEDHKVVIQGVRNESKIEIGSLWEGHEERLNRIVIIGKSIKRAPIEKKIKSILAPDSVVL